MGRPPREPRTPQKAEPKVEAVCESRDTSQDSGASSSCGQSCRPEAAAMLTAGSEALVLGVYLYGICMSVRVVEQELLPTHYIHPG